MIATDSTFLSLMLHPKARPPIDPQTKKRVERMEDRIEKLLDDLSYENERIILPTPALAEFLVLAGADGPKYLDMLSAMRTILVKPFDEMAAIELAAMELADRAHGNKRGGVAAPWQKVKIDRQIVAVAKVNGASKIYSDDEDVRHFAQKAQIEVVASYELPLPAAKQTKIDFPESEK
jgi:predicted nucleic acid-binding protein